MGVKTSDSFRRVKEMVGSIKEQPARKIRIVGSDKEKVFEDEATIADQEVENNAVLYWVLEISEGVFEQVDGAPEDGSGGGEGETKGQ